MGLTVEGEGRLLDTGRPGSVEALTDHQHCSAHFTWTVSTLIQDSKLIFPERYENLSWMEITSFLHIFS